MFNDPRSSLNADSGFSPDAAVSLGFPIATLGRKGLRREPRHVTCGLR
jgi:hypothetical protein